MERSEPVEQGGAGDPAAAPLVMMVCSSGGHLAQLLALRPWWSSRRTVWVTFPTEDATSQLSSERVIPAHHPTTRNVRNLVRNFLLACRAVRQERPDVILSTGAAVALPFFIVGRALGVPTIYIEVYDRIDSTTLSGRLCRPFATRMLVQWEEQRPLYRDAICVGALL